MSMGVQSNNGKLFSSPLLEINTHFTFFSCVIKLFLKTIFRAKIQTDQRISGKLTEKIGDKFGQTFGFDSDFWKNNRNTMCNILPDV